MVVPNDESLPRHILVLPDAARHEIACASDGLRESRVAVGKVDPLQVLEDLIAVENVKIKAGHGLKPYCPRECSGPVSGQSHMALVVEGGGGGGGGGWIKTGV